MSFFAGFFGDQAKTFRPKASHATLGRCKLHELCTATLGVGGDLREAVKLPQGEDVNEWLAVNTVDFFNAASLLYGTITEFCTTETCPQMMCGPKFEYLWADGVKVKKPIKLCARDYVDALMVWVEGQLADRTLFPIEAGDKFPADFAKRVAAIFKRMFRVYGHIYCHHLSQIVLLGAEAHLNTCFRHFYLFSRQFNLIEDAELAPLQDLISSFH